MKMVIVTISSFRQVSVAGCTRGSNGKFSYVAHKPRPDGNEIFPVSLDPGCSLRLLVTSLNTSSNFAALYLGLKPKPNLSVVIIRGFPNTSRPSVRYSKRQSGTVIRNRPNMIAMSLWVSAKICRRGRNSIRSGT